jgi:hypothetical protein
LSAGRERQQIELSLLTLSSMALRASRGFSSPELEALHRRLYDVATELGEVRVVGATLWGMVLYHSVGGDYAKARAEVEQLAALLAEHPHPALRFQPLLLGGIISLFVGDIRAAVSALGEAQAACVPIPPHEYVDLRIESDPRTLCDTFVAWAKCVSGDGAAGLALAEDVLARQDNSLGRIHALQALTNVTGLVGAPARAREIATECVHLCDRVGAPFYGAIARGTLGSALVTLGAAAEGLTTLEQGLATLRAIGARNMEPYLLVEIAEAHRSLGNLVAAAAYVDEARATIGTTGEHLYDAEVLRIDGRVRATRGDAPDEVDGCFRRAAEVARAGGSRLYEQRAEGELVRTARSPTALASASDGGSAKQGTHGM